MERSDRLCRSYIDFPIFPCWKHAAIPKVYLGVGVTHCVPGAAVVLLDIPAVAPTVPYGLREIVLDFGTIRKLRIRSDLHSVRFAGDDRLKDPQSIVDGVFRGHDRRGVARRGVGPQDQEEIRKPAHDRAIVSFWATGFLPVLCQQLAVPADHLQRRDKFVGPEPVGHDDNVRLDESLLRSDTFRDNLHGLFVCQSKI